MRGGQAEAIKKLNAQFQKPVPEHQDQPHGEVVHRPAGDAQARRLRPEPARRGRGEQRLLGDGPARPGRSCCCRSTRTRRRTVAQPLLAGDPAHEPLHARRQGASAAAACYGLPMTARSSASTTTRRSCASSGSPGRRRSPQFETALATAKAAGETPIQFGNLDKWPGIHTFEEPMLQFVSKDFARSWIFGAGTPQLRDRRHPARGDEAAGVGATRATSRTATRGSATTRRGRSSARATASS